MEHSRLLKFLIDPRYKTIMSESPTIKVQNDYETPPNISEEVPGEQKIRESDAADIQELENGDHEHSEYDSVQNNNEINMTAEHENAKENAPEKERRSLEQKKSRIPKLKFRQTVERVKRERRAQKLKEQPHDLPRRSSIPKLIDAKLVTSQELLKNDKKAKEHLQADEKLDEEFDKIYEEIVDGKQKDIDEKILAVKIDDPEKVETKFEQIINAYDNNNDNYLTHTEKLRASKIPWRKKDYERSASLGSSYDKNNNKSTTLKEKLKDGGYKISATTITTKRFSRGHSTDSSHEKNTILEPFNNKKEELIEKTVITELVAAASIETNTAFQEGVLINKSKEVENFDDGNNVTKENVPVKPQRINRGLSRDLNKRPVSLEDRDLVNKEVIKHDELIEGNKIIATEKTARGISRSFSRDGKSITKHIPSKDSKIPVINISNNSQFSQEDMYKPVNVNSETNGKEKIHITENLIKENIKVGIPVYTKTTHSYTKGIVQNVEMVKTIEWKQAPEIKLKDDSTTISENNVKNPDTSQKPFLNKANTDENIVIYIDELPVSPAIETTHSITPQSPLVEDGNEALIEVPEGTANLISDEVKTNVSINSNTAETLRENGDEPAEINRESLREENKTENVSLPSLDQKSLQNVTILKGNVNRLISQISVNENTNVIKKVSSEIETPKKKSVLKKIAMFEGKDPSELNIKITKFSTNNKPLNFNENNNGPVKNEKVVMKKIGTEPIIVDQIWKIQQQDVQNVTLQNIEEVKITPEIADFSLSIDSTAFAENANVSLAPNQKLDGNERHPDSDIYSQIETASMQDNAVVNITAELQTVKTIELLPTKVDIMNDVNEYEQIETNNIPAKIDFIFKDDQEDVVKYEPEKVEYRPNDKFSENEMPKVGKLDLNIWKKQVESNKKFIWTSKSIEANPIQAETLRENQDTKTKYEPVFDTRDEMPTILPAKISITPSVQDEESKSLPNILFSTSHDSQLQVPVVLPETPLTGPETSNYESQFTLNPLQIVIPTKLPGNFKTINQNSYVNIIQSPVNNKEHIAIEPAHSLETIDTVDREMPSDPELVDSEPEIRDNKDTIMGKLKHKMYLITNKNSSDKSVNDQNLLNNTTSVTNTRTSDKYNNSSKIGNDNKFDFEHFNKNVATRVNNEKYVEIKKSDRESREDLRRAKSLAELDLGDAVKGQVQRMVYRIKSVDFERPEAHKSNNINPKEMPRKSSVLEKIALFESKATSTYEKRTKPQKIDQKINSNHAKESSVVPDVDPEQDYLQKIEDLSTAKLRYEKAKMEYVELGNGEYMPVMALGTALMDNRLLPHIISCAIDLGFRAIDTAYIYGNEREIGEGIRRKIDDGTVERKDLYIISKLWSTYHHPELVERACRSSLEALGLEYFDLFLIHNPMSFKEGNDPIPKIASVLQFSECDYLDAWFAMEELVRKGLVRSIGVSNFNSKQIQRILDKGRISPVVNQVESHPYLSQERLQNFCAEHNIHLQCFGVLGATGTPAEYKSPGVTPAVGDPLVKVMASALNVSAAQLLVRYQLQLFRSVVVKSSSSAHLWDLLQTLSFQLQPHELAAISALNKNERIYTFKGMGDTHKNYPFREPF